MIRFQLVFYVFFILISACGAKKVAVKYADSFIETQVEKRLPLYDSQEAALSKDIDKFLNEHKDRVKAIVPILEKIDFNRAASLDEQYPKFAEAYLEIASDFSRILSKYMATFDKKQQKEFLKKLREENNDIFIKDREERRDKIASKTRSFLGGELTKAQAEILQENGKTFDEQVVVRVERRSKLHTDFKTILAQEISTEAKEKLIYEAFVAYQKEALANTKNLTIAKAFIPTLTPDQKKALKQHLMDIQEIIGYFIETAY